jgi:hypothetical protein
MSEKANFTTLSQKFDIHINLYYYDSINPKNYIFNNYILFKRWKHHRSQP